MNNNKLRLTFYMASAIEHSKVVLDAIKEDWKVYIKKELSRPDIGIYDPVEMEAGKTGRQSGDHVHYINNLKKSGHWDVFYPAIDKIWWGNINPDGDKIEIMKALRNRFLIDGNERRDLQFWGDVEAVLRSNFIFAYIERNVKTVGTIREIVYAELFNIPVILILPDQTKTECNSTLLQMCKHSNVCYTVQDAVKLVKEKYNI